MTDKQIADRSEALRRYAASRNAISHRQTIKENN